VASGEETEREAKGMETGDGKRWCNATRHPLTPIPAAKPSATVGPTGISIPATIPTGAPSHRHGRTHGRSHRHGRTHGRPPSPRPDPRALHPRDNRHPHAHPHGQAQSHAQPHCPGAFARHAGSRFKVSTALCKKNGGRCTLYKLMWPVSLCCCVCSCVCVCALVNCPCSAAGPSIPAGQGQDGGAVYLVPSYMW
jgi:hypothetical protein